MLHAPDFVQGYSSPNKQNSSCCVTASAFSICSDHLLDLLDSCSFYPSVLFSVSLANSSFLDGLLISSSTCKSSSNYFISALMNFSAAEHYTTTQVACLTTLPCPTAPTVLVVCSNSLDCYCCLSGTLSNSSSGILGSFDCLSHSSGHSSCCFGSLSTCLSNSSSCSSSCSSCYSGSLFTCLSNSSGCPSSCLSNSSGCSSCSSESLPLPLQQLQLFLLLFWQSVHLPLQQLRLLLQLSL